MEALEKRCLIEVLRSRYRQVRKKEKGGIDLNEAASTIRFRAECGWLFAIPGMWHV